jgi:hypothetical protein
MALPFFHLVLETAEGLTQTREIPAHNVNLFRLSKRATSAKKKNSPRMSNIESSIVFNGRDKLDRSEF